MIDRFGPGRTVLVGAATALVLVALAVVPFLNPVWIGFEQQRAGAVEATGYSPTELDTATGAILADLVFGPPTFDVEVAGEPVLSERERGHMGDVRGVFAGLALLAGAAGVVLAGSWLVAGRRDAGRRSFWRAVDRGARVLGVGVVAIGVVAVVAFDFLFEIFHRLFFASGTYTFDPRSERLVQLFPFQFWFDTAIAVGAVILVLAVLTVVIARRRGVVRETGESAPATAALEGAR